MTVPTSVRPRLAAAARSVTPVRLVAGLLALHVVLKVALLPIAVRTPLLGDEKAYSAGGQAMARALRSFFSGQGVPISDLQEHVIGNGWFMPGMSTLLTPLYLVAPGASVPAARIYVGVLTLVLFLGAVAIVFRVVAWQLAAALAVVPALVPMWVLYSYTMWGDLSAGLVLVVVVAQLVRMWRSLAAGRAPRWRDAALLGVLLGAALYLRSSTLPLVAGLLVLSAIAVLCWTRGSQRTRALLGCGLAAAVLAVMMLPWSYTVSRTFDARVTTTTTLPLSIGYAFGNQDEMCFGPCPPGNTWYVMADFARDVAARTGENQLDVQRRMADHALEGVTPSSYATDVLDNVGRYVFEPTGFENAFRAKDAGGEPPRLEITDPDVVSRLDVHVTKTLYFATLVLAAASVLLVRRTPARIQVVTILASLVTAALMTQPFVHIASPRYWPVFLPMLALMAGSLLIRRDDELSSRSLRRVHIVLAIGWVTVPVVLVGLSRLAT
ncbi:hypothetical protein [Aeromicrobium chenweiae]|uniref:Uncharacterized protein n=1 Tax=Aeromicrobium chenweiae TaxID=2079793 RepID=A0A2S0WKF4_9ACTN|nr:hypothetical protein [Aeromicrobium chenweiae]AWB91720.1 hypothetical protein C3E78_05580 [Aeromicrobium chenweiae]TGN32561.1 hypothetical protein E4L97_07540 [Aeromicrobium chenweiae]